jgi:LysR family transcriptional regulator, glycine cleavage system transcriptional activator
MTHSLNAPPLEGLTALIAAADAGSFTAAAEVLGITHGSVSRRIAGLEAWLGVPVFERRGRGVRLTPAGQRFAAEAREALAILERSAEQWRPRRGRPTVRLSAVPSFARLWLLPRLAELERDDLHIEVIADHRPADLATREADLALRYGLGSWEDVDARPLFSEMLVPAAAPALAAPAAAGLERLTLETMPPLLHDSDSSQWKAWLTDAGLRYRPRWQDRRFEDYDTVLTAACAGLGLVLLRLPLVEACLERGELVRVSDRILPNRKAHFLCQRPGEDRHAVIEAAKRILAIGPVEGS